MMVRKSSRADDDPRNGPVLLRSRLLADGWNDEALRRAVRDGSLRRVRRGAYTPAETWDALDEAGRHGLRCRAAVQQAKAEVVLSHVSGLPEYDAPTWGIDLSEIHLTRPDGKIGRREAGVRQHCGKVLPDDVVERNGVRVMSACRLALEVTTVASTEAALAVMCDLVHRDLTSVAEIRDRYASMEHWPFTLRTDLVIRLTDPLVESVGEARVLHQCFVAGLSRPVPQHEVRDECGRVVARVDFAWPELGVFLEFDGRIKYEKLLAPGERASDVVLREKRREELVCRLTGWTCVRVTWADLEVPGRVAALVRAAVQRRAA